MNYCPACGTKVSGNFCGFCGRPTPAERLTPNGPRPLVASSEVDLVGSREEDVERPFREVGGAVGVSPGAPVPTADRRSLSLETRYVMFAFLISGVVGALVVLVQGVSGTGDVSRFPDIVSSNAFFNMILGMIAYLPTLSVVPLALFLLARTGQDRRFLGLGWPSVGSDVVPGLGIAAAAFGVEILMLIPFSGFLDSHSHLVNNVSVGHEPKYYLLEGIFMSAVTAVTEEVIVNGYFLTRLAQLGWNPRRALIVSLVLRTSYHIYYGVGFVLTIPLGYFVTRSFQKHGRLSRPIAAHFLFDSALFALAILR